MPVRHYFRFRNVLTKSLFAGLLGLVAGTSATSQTVTGAVTDSISRQPLRGAIVQLVPDTGVGVHVVTDTFGRFRFASVLPGRYRIGFLHPVLDSIGLEPTVRQIDISSDAQLRIDLAVPSPAKLREAMCPSYARGKAVITGFVRNARDGSPIQGAAVAADWIELTFQKGGIQRVMPRSDAVTARNGWFALCNVPSDGIMGLFASRGGDSTDVLDVHVPENGFLHHDLYLGGKAGGQLMGAVVSAVSGQPVAGAQVSVAARPPLRADAKGQWVLEDLPLGTRILEVRAVGFYPERRGVDVIAGAPPIRLRLSSMQAVLDTVRVRAARMQDRRASGFEERRREGGGFYITAQDIARKNAQSTAELFTGVRGLRVGFASDTMLSDKNAIVDPDSMKTSQRRILMRGISGDLCSPSIFLNGLYIDRMDVDDLDTWATPREISGIEVYSEATAPVEFQRIGKGCGSIVIWTKR
jgi:hypothetical protein